MMDHGLLLSDVLLKTIEQAQKLAHNNEAHAIFLEVLNGSFTAQSKQEVLSLYDRLKEHCPDVSSYVFEETFSLALLRTEFSMLVLQEMLKVVDAKKESSIKIHSI